jgi:F-type H+-transporting ATPase subunit a
MPENKGLSKITNFKILSFACLILLLQSTVLLASDHGSDTNYHSNEQHQGETHHASTHEKFKPGDMILDHVKDAHDWHIMDLSPGHPVSIPLPVIIYDNGLHVFSSGKFEHGHKVVESKGNHYFLHKGKIYKTDASGHLNYDEKNKVSNEIPMDLSITKNVIALFVSAILLLWIFLSIAKSYKTRGKSAPKGIQSLLEPIIIFIRDEVVKPSVGAHYEKFLPMLLTIFFFIFINNLMGLIPIAPFGANLTGNIAVTMVLSIVVFLVVSFSGNKHYWKHIFMPDVPKALWVLLIPIEILGVVLKPFVLMLRLFANITAGHIIILGFFSLIFIFGEKSAVAGFGTSILSVAFTLFMSVLELLVAFLQAYVFTLLASLYIGSATEEHHHAEDHH